MFCHNYNKLADRNMYNYFLLVTKNIKYVSKSEEFLIYFKSIFILRICCMYNCQLNSNHEVRIL